MKCSTWNCDREATVTVVSVDTGRSTDYLCEQCVAGLRGETNPELDSRQTGQG